MKLFVQNARAGFAHGLFTASAMEGNTPKFGVDLILGPDTKVFKVDEKGVKTPITAQAAWLEVANEAWKGKGKAMLEALEPSKKSLRDGNKRLNKAGDLYDGYEDTWYITAKNAARPTTLDAARNPVTAEDGVIYSGCYVTAIIDVYANTQPTKKGVFASLKGVQFYADGDHFAGGGVASADEFDVVDGAAAADFA